MLVELEAEVMMLQKAEEGSSNTGHYEPGIYFLKILFVC